MSASISNRFNTLLLVLLVLMAGTIIAILAPRSWAGPLDPAGPPSSTLPQVEPRSPIPPVGWDGVSSIPISSAGSYFLTRNLNVPITIAANNVTFDLSGFTLTGGSSVGQNGIAVTAGATRNIVVRNGTLIGSGTATGVFAPAAGRSTFSDLHISGWEQGLHIGTGNAVLRVDSHDNTTAGIEVVNSADFGGSIEDSNFSNNSWGIILSGNNTEVRNSIMDINSYDGVRMDGSYNEVSESRMTGNLRDGARLVGNRNVLVRNHVDANGIGQIYDAGASNIVGPLQQSPSTDPNANIGWW